MVRILARIEIGAQIVAGDARFFLNMEDPGVPDRFSLAQALRHRALSAFAKLAEASLTDSLCRGGKCRLWAIKGSSLRHSLGNIPNLIESQSQTPFRLEYAGGKMVRMSITGHRLAEALELRDVDQSELAHGIGSTQGAISKIIVGKTANSRLMPKIATYLGVPLPWLLGLSDDRGEERVEEFSIAERDWVRQLRALHPDQRQALLLLCRDLSRRSEEDGRHTLHDKQQKYRAAG